MRINAPIGDRNIEAEADRLAPLMARHWQAYTDANAGGGGSGAIGFHQFNPARISNGTNGADVQDGDLSVKNLPKGVRAEIHVGFVSQTTGTNLTVRVYWTTPVAGGGNVSMAVIGYADADGELVRSASKTVTEVWAADSSDDVLVLNSVAVDMTNTGGTAAGDLVHIIVKRFGSSGTDTLNGDMYVWHIEVEEENASSGAANSWSTWLSAHQFHPYVNSNNNTPTVSTTGGSIGVAQTTWLLKPDNGTDQYSRVIHLMGMQSPASTVRAWAFFENSAAFPDGDYHIGIGFGAAISDGSSITTGGTGTTVALEVSTALLGSNALTVVDSGDVDVTGFAIAAGELITVMVQRWYVNSLDTESQSLHFIGIRLTFS